MFSSALGTIFASTITTPDIAWSALIPLLVLSGASIFLLTIASISPKGAVAMI